MSARIVVAAVSCLLAAGCEHPLSTEAGDSQCSNEGIDFLWAPSELKFDFLFVVDNSPGMAAHQERLKDAIPVLLEQLYVDSRGLLSLHAAVITSDLGAGVAPPAGCEKGHGPRYVSVGKSAASGCRAPIGKSWLDYRRWENGDGPSNLPPGQDAVTTLQCMLSVGDDGCEYQQPLEAAHSFLRSPVPDGFLRDEAYLVVVFLSGRDDASAPVDTDLFAPAAAAKWGFDRYERVTRRAVECGSAKTPPPDGPSNGPMSDCAAAATPAPLFDVSRYIDFFSHTSSQGGPKRSPLDVMLIAIDGPTDPFESILADPSAPLDEDYVECAARSESEPLCLPVIQRGCQSKSDPGVRAEPAVRLHQLFSAIRYSLSYSACEDDYRRIAESFVPVTEFGYRCWPYTLRDPENPECYLTDQTNLADGSFIETSIPPCSEAASDATCWRLITDEYWCSAPWSASNQRFVVDRHGRPAPDHTTTLIQCSLPCD